MNPPPEVTEKVVELWRQIGVGRISDRRWKKTLKLAMAYALLCDETPAPRHLGVARWTLWSEPDEETSIRNTVLALTDPVASDVLDCEALLADLKAKAGGLQGAKLQERAEIAGQSPQVGRAGAETRGVTRCESVCGAALTVTTEANTIVNQVLDLMSSGGAYGGWSMPSPQYTALAQAIQSALDADRFDLEDWAAARTAIPSLAHHDDRPLRNSAAIRCRTRSCRLFKSRTTPGRSAANTVSNRWPICCSAAWRRRNGSACARRRSAIKSPPGWGRRPSSKKRWRPCRKT